MTVVITHTIGHLDRMPRCIHGRVAFFCCGNGSTPVTSPAQTVGADILDSLNERPSAVGTLKSHVIHSSPSTPTTATSGGGQ